VVQSLRKTNPDAIEAVTRELEDGMMHRLLSQVAARRPKAPEGQADLFAGYPGLVQLISIEVIRDGRRTIEVKQLQNATLNELAAWLAQDHRSTMTRRQRKPGMTKLLRDLSKAAKGQMGMSVGKAMNLLRKGG